MSNQFASALIACFRYYKSSHSIGSRRLYDAVNEAFVASAVSEAIRYYGPEPTPLRPLKSL